MGKRVIAIGLLAALALVILSPLASAFPDGLERVAEDLGFIDRAQEPAYQTLPDYTVPGVSDEALSTIMAGVIGALVVFLAAWGLGAVVRRRDGSEGTPKPLSPRKPVS